MTGSVMAAGALYALASFGLGWGVTRLGEAIASRRMPLVMRGRRHVYPHLYDRLIKSGTPPAYARPAPPARDLLATAPTRDKAGCPVERSGYEGQVLDDPSAKR